VATFNSWEQNAAWLEKKLHVTVNLFEVWKTKLEGAIFGSVEYTSVKR